jgi:hypothetical protein
LEFFGRFTPFFLFFSLFFSLSGSFPNETVMLLIIWSDLRSIHIHIGQPSEHVQAIRQSSIQLFELMHSVVRRSVMFTSVGSAPVLLRTLTAAFKSFCASLQTSATMTRKLLLTGMRVM